MIVRRAKHERDYSVISRHTLEDPKPKMKARGLLAYLLAKPDDWKIHVRQLAKALGISKNTAAEALTDLEYAGYADKQKHRDEKGRLSGFEYVVYEERQREARERPPRPKNRDMDRVPEIGTVSQKTGSGELGHTKYPLDQVSKEKERAAKDAAYLPLAEELAAAVKKTYPRQRCNPAGWIRDIRLLIESDHATTEEVRQVLAWLPGAPTNGSFSWAKNILSGAKLRKHFARLLPEASRNGNGQAAEQSAEQAAAALFGRG
jgi:DNA-binding MarR family transcriptional regulator